MTQALLLYPPITDSTSPYHSLVYVASFAQRAGFPDIEIRDTNIEALDFCARPDVLSAMTAEWRSRRRHLGSRPTLPGLEQLEYAQLVRAEVVDPERVAAAIHLLRDPIRFYDYPAYRAAAETVGHWIESLSCSGVPGQFSAGGHALRLRGCFSLSSVSDLTNEPLLERIVGPFVAYYRQEFFPDLVRKAPAVVGINVTYTSQLPYALWLVRQIRRVLPETFIVCGGTEVAGLWKYLRDRRRLADLFTGADACVVGEGETAFVRLLEAALAGRSPAPIDNVVRLDRRTRRVDPPPGLHYENLEALPTPNYGLMDSRLYFAPHPFVYYSPTRGCYWNRCTFCDYGLNVGSPTSPWRQTSVERTIEDLRHVSRHSRHVYLSVDVLAPARLLQLASALVDAGIDLRWSAEIRLERFFTPQRCEVLRRSGCVAVSVGFESGSQRVLDLIDKGVTLSDVEQTVKSFAGAGVAVQMMGFTGFPSETYNEALASVRFLARTAPSWTVAALGTFVLTPGAILAREPGRAGVEAVRPFAGDDIARMLHIEPKALPARPPENDDALRRAKRELTTGEFDRPFASGIDAAHSIFYYGRFGRRFPRDFVPLRSRPPWRFDPGAVLTFHGAFVEDEKYDVLHPPAVAALAEAHNRAGADGAALDHDAVMSHLRSLPTMNASVAGQHFIVRASGALVPCPAEMRDILDHVDGKRTVADIEAALGSRLEAWPVDSLSSYAVALGFVARGAGGREVVQAPTRTGSAVFAQLVAALVDAGILVAGESRG